MTATQWLGRCILIGALASGAAAQDQPIDTWGNPLWPAEQGAPAGHPGAFDDRDDAGEPRFPVWGQPELQNYPGSIEHYRDKEIKYRPSINPFNADTLVRNWTAVDLGLDTEPYIEPIYYLPMYGSPVFTDRHREAVAVHRLKQDGSNAIRIDLGSLERSMYAVRVIAAIGVQPNDWTGDPHVLVMRFTINDGPDGAVRSFTRRHRAVDEFYAVGEWYFQATDDRDHQVTIELDSESEIDLLVHNVDLHDTLAGIPEAPIKTQATIYTTASREAAQAHYAAHNETNRDWGPNIHLPRSPGLWAGEPLAPDARQERDRMLWNLKPPQLMNFQAGGQYGKYDVGAPSADEVASVGQWQLPFETRYQRNWAQPRKLVNETLDLEYTMDDFLAQRPLPAPYPYSDRGWGVHIPERGYFHPLLTHMVNEDPAYQLLGHNEVGALLVEYFNRNNLHAARDAALLLVREAYTLPSLATVQKRRLQQVVSRPQQTFGLNDPVLRRFTGRRLNNVIKMARAYDLLFDFIKDNDELAGAVNEFLPWVRTPEDVRAFLDQRILGWGIQRVLENRVGSTHGTTEAAITLATIAQDPVVTQPLMEYLFTATYDYPLPLSGVQDYMVTGTTRDGTTTTGSFMYTAGGSPFLEVADLMSTYIANGGDARYNLADPQRYPKPFFGAYFNLEARVAGLWPIGVGDVGGVMRYGQWFDSQETAVRLGWKYLKDPKLAYILFHHFGRKGESQAEWDAVEQAAGTVTRDPWMANRSRMLSAWAGILESGTQHDDPRFRRAATVRVGVGWGHSHRDTLDLQVYGLGVKMTPDGGQRPGYGRPDATLTMNHNLVEVDGDGSQRAGNWEGHAWIRTLADLPDSPMLVARAVPPSNKPQVSYAQRTVALLSVDEGAPAAEAPNEPLGPTTAFGKDVVLPSSYVFDVYRIAGGTRHTYAFHGVPEDEFTVNAIDPRDVPLPEAAEEGDFDARYLNKFVLEGYQGAGDAPDTVIATWRLGREPFEFETVSRRTDEGKLVTYKASAPEQLMLGPNFDADAPRKFIRLHLLDQQGGRLMWGRWVSAPYNGTQGQWFTQLMSMHDGEDDRQSVFPAVIETYAGEPAIASTELLAVRDNDADVHRAVAVRVKTTNGHDDLLFADGRPEQVRTIDTGDRTVTASGEYAYLSLDEQGLRQAGVVGGEVLDVPGVVALRLKQRAYVGQIQGIDQVQRRFTLGTELPGELIGHAFWDVGNDEHRTSLEVLNIDASEATFRKGLELVSTRVVSIDPQRNVVVGRLTSILMGAEEDNGMKPGMTAGLWASNADMSKWWRCTYTGGSREQGYTYELVGEPISEADFPPNGTLRIWELGPSDDVRLATWANLQRDAAQPGRYLLRANVACTVALPVVPGGYEMSSDGEAWQPAPVDGNADGTLLHITLNEQALGSGTLHLRPAGQ